MEFNSDDFLPGVSIDCVVFGFENGTLKVLLTKWKGLNEWSLPGGHVLKEEDPDDASRRILEDRTGLKNIFLDQFKVFGAPDRIPKEAIKNGPTLESLPDDARAWILQRFITIGYLALIDIRKADIKPDHVADKIGWWPVTQMPDLIFDHAEIVNVAVKELKIQLNYLPLGLNLLPEKFTMNELQQLYENILGKQLDRGNFQKKILKLDILERLEKLKLGGAHKAPYLYRFDKQKYRDLLSQGIGL